MLGLSFQKSFGEILTRLGRLGSLGVKCDIERFIFIASANGYRRRVGVEGVRPWSLSRAPGWNWKGALHVTPGEPASFITRLDYKIEAFTEWPHPCMWSWLRGPSGAFFSASAHPGIGLVACSLSWPCLTLQTDLCSLGCLHRCSVLGVIFSLFYFCHRKVMWTERKGTFNLFL